MADGYFSEYNLIDFRAYVDSDGPDYSVAPTSDNCGGEPNWEYISYETNSSGQSNYITPNEWHRFRVVHDFVAPYESCDDDSLERIFYYNPPTNTDCGSIADFLVEVVPTINLINCDVSIDVVEDDTDCNNVSWSEVFRDTPPVPLSLTNNSDGCNLSWTCTLEDNYSPTQFKVYRSGFGSSGPYSYYDTSNSKSYTVNQTGYYKVATYVDGLLSGYSNYIQVTSLSKHVVGDDSEPKESGNFTTALFSPSIDPVTFSAKVIFELAEESTVNIKIYDLLGRRVAALPINHYQRGQHSVVWNGVGEVGQQVDSGVYLIELRTDNKRFFSKLVMTK